jgi:hypothetical protein
MQHEHRRQYVAEYQYEFPKVLDVLVSLYDYLSSIIVGTLDASLPINKVQIASLTIVCTYDR